VWEYVEDGWILIAFILLIGSAIMHVMTSYSRTKSTRANNIVFNGGLGVGILAIIAALIRNTSLAIPLFALSTSLLSIYWSLETINGFDTRTFHSLTLQDNPLTRFSLYLALLPRMMLSVLGMLSVILSVSFYAGQFYGRSFVANNRPLVILTSQTPLRIAATDVTSSTVDVEGTRLFTYDGLYLLESNKERYWLYTCVADDGKPLRVYVVPNDDLATVEIVPLDRTPPACTTTRSDVYPLPSTTALPSASAVPSP